MHTEPKDYFQYRYVYRYTSNMILSEEKNKQFYKLHVNFSLKAEKKTIKSLIRSKTTHSSV